MEYVSHHGCRLTRDVFDISMVLNQQRSSDPRAEAFKSVDAIVGAEPGGGIAVLYGIEALEQMAAGKAANKTAMKIPFDPDPSCDDLELLIALCHVFRGGDCYGKKKTESALPSTMKELNERFRFHDEH